MNDGPATVDTTFGTPISLARFIGLPAEASLAPDIGDHFFDLVRAAVLKATRQRYRQGVTIHPGRPHFFRSVSLEARANAIELMRIPVAVNLANF